MSSINKRRSLSRRFKARTRSSRHSRRSSKGAKLDEIFSSQTSPGIGGSPVDDFDSFYGDGMASLRPNKHTQSSPLPLHQASPPSHSRHQSHDLSPRTREAPRLGKGSSTHGSPAPLSQSKSLTVDFSAFRSEIDSLKRDNSASDEKGASRPSPLSKTPSQSNPSPSGEHSPSTARKKKKKKNKKKKKERGSSKSRRKKSAVVASQDKPLGSSTPHEDEHPCNVVTTLEGNQGASTSVKATPAIDGEVHDDDLLDDQASPPSPPPSSSVTDETQFRRWYALGSVIYKGISASVVRATRQQGSSSKKDDLAVKVYHSGIWPSPQSALDQLAPLMEVSHPSIVRVHAIHCTPEHAYVVMDRARGTELFQSIATLETFTEDDVRNVITSLSEVLAHLHAYGRAHGDMKPENILYAPPTRITLMECGMAMPTRETTAEAAIAADMWALGALAFTMLSGFPPYMCKWRQEHCSTKEHTLASTEAHAMEDLYAPFDGPEDARSSIERHCVGVTQEAKDFVQSLLLCDDTSAPSSAENCLRHPWLQPVMLQSPRTRLAKREAYSRPVAGHSVLREYLDCIDANTRRKCFGMALNRARDDAPLESITHTQVSPGSESLDEDDSTESLPLESRTALAFTPPPRTMEHALDAPNRPLSPSGAPLPPPEEDTRECVAQAVELPASIPTPPPLTACVPQLDDAASMETKACEEGVPLHRGGEERDPEPSVKEASEEEEEEEPPVEDQWGTMPRRGLPSLPPSGI